MHLIVSTQISIEVKRQVSSIEIQAGNREGFFNLCKMTLVDYCIQF